MHVYNLYTVNTVINAPLFIREPARRRGGWAIIKTIFIWVSLWLQHCSAPNNCCSWGPMQTEWGFHTYRRQTEWGFHIYREQAGWGFHTWAVHCIIPLNNPCSLDYLGWLSHLLSYKPDFIWRWWWHQGGGGARLKGIFVCTVTFIRQGSGRLLQCLRYITFRFWYQPHEILMSELPHEILQ